MFRQELGQSVDEVEFGHGPDRHPLGLGGIVARPGLTVLEDRDPEIQDHEVVFAVEDLGPADERPTEADEAGLLLQLPQGGLGHGFTVFDASTREGPSALSRVGKREGIHFENNGWVWLCLLGTLLSACSGLYDKYLLGRLGYAPATVQAWFSIYLLVYMLIPGLGYYRGW